MLMLQKYPRYLSFFQLHALKKYIYAHENSVQNSPYNIFLYQYYHYFFYPFEIFLLINVVILLLFQVKARSHPFAMIWKILQIMIFYIALSYLNKLICNSWHSYMFVVCFVPSVILLFLGYRLGKSISVSRK